MRWHPSPFVFPRVHSRFKLFFFSYGNGSAFDLQCLTPQLLLKKLRSEGFLGFGDLFGCAFGDDLAAKGKNDRPNGDIFLVEVPSRGFSLTYGIGKYTNESVSSSS